MNIPVNKKKFIELLKQDLYKKSLVDSMIININDEDLKLNLKSDLEYVISNRLDVFENINGGYFDGDEEDEIETLIIPSIRRAWSMVFINKPTLFNAEDKRLELFQLYWDVDDFLNHLMIFLPKVKNSLIEFIYLDIVSETLNLVCQNYINKLISDSRNKTKEEIKIEIRDLKLKKMLK